MVLSAPTLPPTVDLDHRPWHPNEVSHHSENFLILICAKS